MDVVLIGGTIEALLVADHYSKDHNVSIIEIEAELGLPSVHPGRFIDVDLFKSYFTEAVSYTHLTLPTIYSV